MPAKRTYQPQRTAENPTIPGILPLDRAVAVYYRQSSLKQVGNISTDMQQIDLPRYAKSLGWEENQILLVDEDEGVSGAKRIDERKGMSRLYNLIINEGIGTVVVQAEDRLFRDETQIQVNVFIDACVKSNVRVITPYFKYNFADKYEGPYHRLLFRMRAEQAADYLNSYVRGRLMAAKERMLLQGMWMGGNISLGFMVDDRKNLSGGVPNPSWRKYEPFSPCSEIVVKLFHTFVECGGNIRATLRRIYENGPHFPDFDDPELQRYITPGYIWQKPMRMIKRGGIYMPGSLGIVNMMTNPVYLGHWMYKGHIVVWNNHPPIVPEDLFYRAFNYLSPYTLEGKSNPDYAPRLGRVYSTKRKEGVVPPAIYTGLVGSYHEEKWRGATVAWVKSIQSYSYVCHYMDVADNQHLLWSRRCEYFDNAITQLLHAKLRATFDSNVWEESLTGAGEDFEAERRMLSHQLSSVEQKMQAIIGNSSFVQSESYLHALENEYTNLDQEKVRLQGKLADLERRVEHQDSLLELAKQANRVLEAWDEIDVDTKQAVAQGFISRIVVNPVGKHRVANVEICWLDNTSDSIQVAYRTDGSIVWFPKEVDALTQLIESQANQVTIAAALPDRNWRAIRLKAYEIIGQRSFQVSPKPIREDETYPQYLERIEKTNGNLPRNRSRWIPEEIERLQALLDAEATQLEIAAALPHRSWEKIRSRITALRGKEFKVRETGYLQPNETIQDYITQNPSAANTMEISILTNLSQHSRC